MKGEAHPSLFAAFSSPNSKKVPIYCWVDRGSYPVVAWRSQASNSRPYGDFLHRSNHSTRALLWGSRKKREKKKHKGPLIVVMQICLYRQLPINFKYKQAFFLEPLALNFQYAALNLFSDF